MVQKNVGCGLDVDSQEIISAEVSVVNVGDSEVLPTSINPLRRKVYSVSGDGAYDNKRYHEVLHSC